MESWRAPLDEFTLRYLVTRLVEDREKHLREAQEARQHAKPHLDDDNVGEADMVRAEECARVIEEIKKIIGLHSEPPPQRGAKGV